MDFKEMTLLQLKAYAKEKGIRGISTLKKEQLVEKLMENEKYGEKREEKKEENIEVKREENRKENKRANKEEKRKEHRKEHTEESKKENREEEKAGDKAENKEEKKSEAEGKKNDISSLDSGNMANGILEVMPDGYGFIRCENYLPGENDVYVSPSQIRRFNLKTGDILVGNIRIKTQNEKYSALLYVQSVNGYKPFDAAKRKNFEDLTPIFPNERINLETENAPLSMRMVDLLSPIGKGQRGMIVSQPKTGKTTLLKQIARSITATRPNMKVIVLLIDERPEKVTDIKEAIQGPNVEVIYCLLMSVRKRERTSENPLKGQMQKLFTLRLMNYQNIIKECQKWY